MGASTQPQPARVLFARHGQSTANLLRVISNRDAPHPLTELGRRQALDLAEAIRPEGVRRILSSPIPRAMETAEIVARAIGGRVETADALREFDCGEYEGRSDDAAWAAHSAVIQEWLELLHPDARLAGGESLTEQMARFVPELDAVAGELRADAPGLMDGKPRATLLVSHGGFLRCVLPQVLDPARAALVRGRYLGNAEVIGADVDVLAARLRQRG